MKYWSQSVKAFVGIFILYEVGGWLFVSTYERLDQLQLINGNHSQLADLLFQALTATAEVVLPILLLLYLIRFQKAYALSYVYSYALSTGLIQGLKHLLIQTHSFPVLSRM